MKKIIILSLILAIVLISGSKQIHQEGEIDVISSMKFNQDENLTVIANKNKIEDKERLAKLLIKKYKDNSFKSIKFSTDYGYATSLNIRVFLWEYQVRNQDPVMKIEYIPVKWGQGYDVVRNPEKFQMYIDGELVEY